MKIKKNCRVSVEYVMSLPNGDEIDSADADAPLDFVCGRGDVIIGLERELMGLEAGARKTFTIRPEDAYGQHDAGLVQELPTASLPPGTKAVEGASFSRRSERGAEEIYRIAEVRDATILADPNHPLAGKVLHCDVHILNVDEDHEPKF